MIRVLILAGAVVGLSASAAFAQDDGPVRTAPTAAAPANTAVPDEAAVEAAAAGFETQMDEMAKELEAAKTASGSDAAALKTASDAIVAKYQPGADAFAEMVAALIASRPVPPEAQTRAREAVQQVRDMPGLIRDHHLAAPAPASLPATPPPAP
ncbi:hypothetical protein [Brevundimonas goettingensis]|uniref:Translation initiation factor IF-2 n=1 Tax=Brevundimonas goettingensis TaxID=2774190 RepID=A0A975GW43_9CAUL|nr:hypothetical protein [Brevundimonas goettingensis]QTC91344.1 hypothetical protein IFJ75_19480 [Brevundimonas goettingensis]